MLAKLFKAEFHDVFVNLGILYKSSNIHRLSNGFSCLGWSWGGLPLLRLGVAVELSEKVSTELQILQTAVNCLDVLNIHSLIFFEEIPHFNPAL